MNSTPKRQPMDRRRRDVIQTVVIVIGMLLVVVATTVWMDAQSPSPGGPLRSGVVEAVDQTATDRRRAIVRVDVRLPDGSLAVVPRVMLKGPDGTTILPVGDSVTVRTDPDGGPAQLVDDRVNTPADQAIRFTTIMLVVAAPTSWWLLRRERRTPTPAP